MKIEDFIDRISVEFSKTCDCHIPAENFADERLICETKRTDKVVFQSRLVVTDDKNTTELLADIIKWADTNPHVVVQGIQLNVDKNCSVELMELGDGECISTTEPPPPETTASREVSTPTESVNETGKSEKESPVSYLVPSVALGGSAIFVIIVIIVVIIIVVKPKRKAK